MNDPFPAYDYKVFHDLGPLQISQDAQTRESLTFPSDQSPTSLEVFCQSRAFEPKDCWFPHN